MTDEQKAEIRQTVEQFISVLESAEKHVAELREANTELADRLESQQSALGMVISKLDALDENGCQDFGCCDIRSSLRATCEQANHRKPVWAVTRHTNGKYEHIDLTGNVNEQLANSEPVTP